MAKKKVRRRKRTPWNKGVEVGNEPLFSASGQDRAWGPVIRAALPSPHLTGVPKRESGSTKLALVRARGETR